MLNKSRHRTSSTVSSIILPQETDYLTVNKVHNSQQQIIKAKNTAIMKNFRISIPPKKHAAHRRTGRISVQKNQSTSYHNLDLSSTSVQVVIPTTTIASGSREVSPRKECILNKKLQRLTTPLSTLDVSQSKQVMKACISE